MKNVFLWVFLFGNLAHADWSRVVNLESLSCKGIKTEDSTNKAFKNVNFVEIKVLKTKNKLNGSLIFREKSNGPQIAFMKLNPSTTTEIQAEGAPYTQYEANGGDGFRVNLYENKLHQLEQIGYEGKELQIIQLPASIDVWKFNVKELKYLKMFYNLECNVHFKLK